GPAQPEPADPCPGLSDDAPRLVALPNAVQLKGGATKGSFVIFNCGEAPIVWSVSSKPYVDFPETTGALAGGFDYRVRFTVDTSGLSAGPFSFKIKVTHPGHSKYLDISGTKLAGFAAPSAAPSVGGAVRRGPDHRQARGVRRPVHHQGMADPDPRRAGPGAGDQDPHLGPDRGEGRHHGAGRGRRWASGTAELRGDLVYVNGQYRSELETGERKVKAPAWVGLDDGDREPGRSVLIENAPDQIAIQVQGREYDGREGICEAAPEGWTPFSRPKSGRGPTCEQEVEWNTASGVINLDVAPGALPSCYGFPSGVNGEACYRFDANGDDPRFEVYLTIDFVN
ncbi:MAG: hypothetical protein ACRDTM_11845, partial [Micromonosporaceae bacterium]